MTEEIRTADLWPIDMEMRALGEDGFEFEGYAAKYNEPSLPLAFPQINRGRAFREVIRPGAFTKTLTERPDLALVVNHELKGIPLARTGGTMTITDDNVGLKIRATLPDNEMGRPVRDAIRRGDLRGMSFRFDKALDKWTPGSDQTSTRELLEVRLRSEVSMATFPAYDATEATVRALAEEVGVDPDALIAGLQNLAPGDAGAKPINREQRDALITVINTLSDAPVIDVARAQKQALMRERLQRLAG